MLSNSEQVSARNLVNTLLEADEIDPDDIELSDLISGVKQDQASGKITFHAALTANTFYHRRKKYKGADVRPLEVRRNGKTKTWKTRPGQFRIPVKYGLYEFGYIDNNNADDWSTVPNPEEKVAYWRREQEQARKDKERAEIEKLQAAPLQPPTPEPELGLNEPVRDPNQPELFDSRKSVMLVSALLN